MQLNLLFILCATKSGLIVIIIIIIIIIIDDVAAAAVVEIVLFRCCFFERNSFLKSLTFSETLFNETRSVTEKLSKFVE